jgi:serine/threonine protein kinase
VSRTDPVLPDWRTSGRVAGYRLEERLGESDVAVVRLAHDERLDRRVAVKIVSPELAGDAAFRARFLSESRAAAAIGHPHIVPVYEAGDAGGMLYAAMRYAGGGDVRLLLSRLGPLPLAQAWGVIARMASALDAAHGRGLIHRDVKLANILLDADHVYLSDFGMGRDLSPEIIAAGQFAGTLDYLAPEQIQGRALDGRADLYSLACAGFELLCGTPPFGQDHGLTVMYSHLYVPPPSASARRPDLPAAVDRVLATALAKNPADRYPSCGQFAGELRIALGLRPGGPAPTPRPSAPGRPRVPEDQPSAGPGEVSPDSVSGPGRPVRHRSRVIALIIALAAVVMVAAVAIGVVLSAKPTGSSSAVGKPASSSPAATSAPPSSPAPTPTPTPTAALASTQAAAVGELLGSSAATRKALQGAVSEAGDCTNLSGAVRQIQNAVNQRSTEYSQASALSTSAMTDGTIVKTDLTAALHTSLVADKDYLAWARQQLTLGCVPATQSDAYTAAYNADQQANAAKEAFVQVWDPVAARYGIQQESPDSI